MTRIPYLALVAVLVAAAALPWRASAVHGTEGMKVMANTTHRAK